jgi:hypothetical protein
MPQTTQTVSEFGDKLFVNSQMKPLDDLDAGDMAGLTFDEIATLQPAVYAARKRHKLLYRWPGLGGECYVDLIHRLRPIILDLERRKDHVLLVTHRAVVRVLLSYFLDLRRDDLAEMVIPKNWGFSLEPVRISLWEAVSREGFLLTRARFRHRMASNSVLIPIYPNQAHSTWSQTLKAGSFLHNLISQLSLEKGIGRDVVIWAACSINVPVHMIKCAIA